MDWDKKMYDILKSQVHIHSTIVLQVIATVQVPYTSTVFCDNYTISVQLYGCAFFVSVLCSRHQSVVSHVSRNV
jgi:hypothetical protein